MLDSVNFFSALEEQQIVAAIQLAEKNTSGEIRIHVEKTSKTPPFERAKEVFELLKMHETELKNGILIYIAHESKQVAIIGDKGIHEFTGDDFWNSELETLLHFFKNGKYVEGLSIVVNEIGIKLKTFFPFDKDDKNELSDEISNGHV
jgi:uncharacterized membrane protein